MSTPSTMTLATRRSKLALAQARAYVRELEGHHDGLRIEELHVVTSGDRFQDRPLQELGGKGLFIKEIEEALLDKRADIAVHSIKDVPAELAPRLFHRCDPETSTQASSRSPASELSQCPGEQCMRWLREGRGRHHLLACWGANPPGGRPGA